MLLGVSVSNFSVFDNDKIGILLDDLSSADKDPFLTISAGLTPEIPMPNLMALIGRNSSGKTSFFGALSFVCDCTNMGCSAAATAHGRPGFFHLLTGHGKPMIFEFLFQLQNGHESGNGPEDIIVSYRMKLDADAHGRPFYASEKVIRSRKCVDGSWDRLVCLDLAMGEGTVICGGEQMRGGVADTRISALRSYGALTTCPLLHSLFHEITHWFFCDFSSEFRAAGNGVAPGGHKHLNCDGSNLENVLEYIRSENPALYPKIIERITEKIPNIGKESNKLPASFKKSPGKLFLYLLLLEDPMPRPLICVETPDIGLYHDMVDILATEFRQYSIRHPYSQILFTTHNPYILESMSPNEVWIFKRVEEDSVNLVDIACAGADPAVAEMYRQGVGLGAIWYSGHFDD
jgi:predicted ATPase